MWRSVSRAAGLWRLTGNGPAPPCHLLPRRLMADDHRRVVWSEGMTLDPHHFQQWDRHHRRQLHERLRALEPNGWGLTRLLIDDDRLANGELALREATALLPDGLLVDLPGDAPLPDPRPLDPAFPPTRDRLRAFLAIPNPQVGAALVRRPGAPSSREARFLAEPVEVTDETTGGDDRPVEVARPAVRLMLDGEAMHGYAALGVAEIVRTGSGGFAHSADFIPTGLRLAASARLAERTRQLAERLFARHGALAERWQRAATQRELSPGDVAAQALLAAVAEYGPRVEHLRQTDAHPADLFGLLLGLAGRLGAARPEAAVAPRELPLYDHGSPSDGFKRLFDALDRLLSDATPRANYARQPFTRSSPNLAQALLSPDLARSAALYLAARHPTADAQRLRHELPALLRVASPDTIEAVLRSYTRALPVEPVAQPPAGLPADGRAGFFELQRRGPFWDAIQDAGQVSVFVPDEFAGAELELLGIPA